MILPQWAKPLDSKAPRYCDCEERFVAIARVQLAVFGRKFWYNLCPACLVCERENKREIVYRQTERWLARLKPVLTQQRLQVIAEQEAKRAAAKEAKRGAHAKQKEKRADIYNARLATISAA